MEYPTLLKNCPLCRDLDPSELAALTDIASFRKINKDEIVFFEGDPATGFFVLLKGQVRIYKAAPDGREYTLHRIGPGQMFAEAAIFRGHTFPANAAATEPSITAFFPKDRFIALITASPQISMKMFSALSAFIRDFNRQVESLSLKNVSARLASYLLDKLSLSPTRTVRLEVSKSELARSLGTISATLSRNLKKMRELGIIEVSGQNITVLNTDRLKNIAEGDKI
ncbi:MAG: Crp/Fnr family transcriptional regulator [Candidatus Zixiibacteriota bacterium]